MNKIFYISDLHFGHDNIIKYDNRPFKNTKEMEEKIIENWNNTVDNDDTVYILGDVNNDGKLDPAGYEWQSTCCR